MICFKGLREIISDSRLIIIEDSESIIWSIYRIVWKYIYSKYIKVTLMEWTAFLIQKIFWRFIGELQLPD